MFSFEKWLSAHTYWEDPDSQLIFMSTKDEGVSISDFEHSVEVEGKTLEEACNNFSKEIDK